MITRLLIENLRGITHAELELGPITALVGPNGAGKTTIVSALRLVGSITNRYSSHFRYRYDQTRPRWLASGAPPSRIRVEVTTGAGDGSWDLTFGDNEGAMVPLSFAASWRTRDGATHLIEGGSGKAFDLTTMDVWTVVALTPVKFGTGPEPSEEAIALVRPFSPLGDELRGILGYDFTNGVIEDFGVPDESMPLGPRAENYVPAFKSLTDADREALTSVMRRLTGTIAEVALQRNLLTTTQTDGKQTFINNESGGTRRVFAMMLALLQRPTPSLVAIEEPEVAIHPGALRMLAEEFEEASRREQVLLTTHSPDLLDWLPPECLRVVTRRDGVTSVTSLADEQLALAREKVMRVGELLRAEGLRGS